VHSAALNTATRASLAIIDFLTPFLPGAEHAA